METFLQILARKGIADPKIRSVKANRASHARYGVDKMRKFPPGYGTADWPMVETIESENQPDPYPAIPECSDSTEYVREFCKLNHLKG